MNLKGQMALTEVFFFFFVVMISFLVLICLQPSTCTVVTCADSCGELSIRFPFQLSSQPERCGYPHFTLECNHTQTTITMPFESDQFVVDTINYWSQTIFLIDPDNCSPRRFLEGLNLSNTYFQLLDPENYTFFNCSNNVTLPPETYVSCLSDRSFSVGAIPTNLVNQHASLVASCLEIATVAVPAFTDPNFGVLLTWSEPDCKFCEHKAGTCGFKSDTGLDVGCSGGFSSGHAKGAEYGIAFVGIPLLCVIGLVLYLKRKGNKYNQHCHQPYPGREISIPVTPRRLDAVDSK